MFEFICIQYKMGNLTKEQVQNFSPKYITEEEVNKIIK